MTEIESSCAAEARRLCGGRIYQGQVCQAGPRSTILDFSITPQSRVHRQTVDRQPYLCTSLIQIRRSQSGHTVFERLTE